MNQKTIFITIPAYEDPQLISTIESAIENALFPDRLFFCVAMQYKQMPDISKYENNPNFTFIFYDVDKRPGIYYIRKEMSEKHSGQDYFMMIDSHMIFNKYWDVILINDYTNLVNIHGDRVVLSKPTTEKIGLTLDNGHIDDVPEWKINYDHDPSNIQRTILPSINRTAWNGEQFIRTPYICNHFFFSNSSFLNEVGFHDNVMAYGEEVLVSLSAFMSGWDVYSNPLMILVGHNSEPTTMAIYGTKNYSIAEGKLYGAILDSEDEKLEIAKFILTGKSNKFFIKNLKRSADEYYEFAKISNAQETLKTNIGIF